ncbi:sulfotransferase domain-containing protein [Reichenbachiella sp.]|uniref:sulfotransferase domain-containing protein n=1 Tax=Reichenbachiella sp. TaxID=2184521 RepID=UPI00329839E6
MLNNLPFCRTNDFQRFVILCDPRTGSTWLHTLLNSSDQILSYGELLTERNLTQSLEKTIWHDHHQSIKAIGCKIFYEQLSDPKFKKLLTEISENKSIKIIDLKRENMVECFVSLKIAEKTQSWSNDAKGTSKVDKLSINIEELEAFIKERKGSRSQVLNLLGDHKKYKTTYEQLVGQTRKELEDLQSFLGVEPMSMFSLLNKQNSASLEDLISNFEEIKSDLDRLYTSCKVTI